MFMRIMAGRRSSQRDAEQRFDAWLAEADHTQGGIDVRQTLPCDTQTPEFVAGWMQDHGAPGVVVVVRHVQLGLYEYLLDEVRRTDLRLKRVYLADHGVFRLNGDYLAPPRGRFSLLAPIGNVLDAAVDGDTWMNGRPAFRRPHSSRERALVDAARQQHDERD
jgi:hypothetical protein